MTPTSMIIFLIGAVLIIMLWPKSKQNTEFKYTLANTPAKKLKWYLKHFPECHNHICIELLETHTEVATWLTPLWIKFMWEVKKIRIIAPLYGYYIDYDAHILEVEPFELRKEFILWAINQEETNHVTCQNT